MDSTGRADDDDEVEVDNESLEGASIRDVEVVD